VTQFDNILYCYVMPVMGANFCKASGMTLVGYVLLWWATLNLALGLVTVVGVALSTWLLLCSRAC